MRIVVVDDDKAILSSLERFLKRYGHNVFTFFNPLEAAKFVAEERVDLLLSDINMPEIDGLQLLKMINDSSFSPFIQVVLFTGYGKVKNAVEAMKLGAFDYLLKPIELSELEIILQKVEEFISLKTDNLELKTHFDEKLEEKTKEISENFVRMKENFAKTIGLKSIGIFSSKMQEVFDLAAKFHQHTDVPVLIEGETGTGKEIIAKFIHYGKEINPLPFVDLNCASIPSALFESELFGYEKGSFTGGDPQGKAGKLEFASNGTLFLDEIGEMPLELQSKLLRVIQERTYYRIGSVRKNELKARIIVATNRHLKEEAEQGRFRNDLYYRLNVGYIYIPPLRDRKDEIIPLAEMFIRELVDAGRSSFRSISHEAEKVLKEYPWKGNIREMKNILERTSLLYDDNILDIKHLHSIITENELTAENSVTPSQESMLLDSESHLNDQIEKIILGKLEVNKWNKLKTAKELGISRNKLYWYLNKFKIKY
ncbi:MAG: sigma-54 dependent transcriptional regulator [Candidatus Cloacimonetes bacterium]|nr:sigma-54 dependent transcriptional regulator [Candidatus Cloacimonadota bacterium]